MASFKTANRIIRYSALYSIEILSVDFNESKSILKTTNGFDSMNDAPKEIQHFCSIIEIILEENIEKLTIQNMTSLNTPASIAEMILLLVMSDIDTRITFELARDILIEYNVEPVRVLKILEIILRIIDSEIRCAKRSFFFSGFTHSLDFLIMMKSSNINLKRNNIDFNFLTKEEDDCRCIRDITQIHKWPKIISRLIILLSCSVYEPFDPG